MALPDSISVSETGGAIQSFPIAVPAGTAGVVPSLQLTYNSQGQNGIVGMGFMLNGLPTIGRCPQTKATDGQIDGVSFDANDRFCLDGQRLIAVSGTYGADGTEYRTELESFTKVISHGSAGTGPAWFKVWTKSGQVMEFGNSTDSRILATGRAEARSWAVNEVADTKGNFYTVSYVNDTANGQSYPSRIDYTGNAGAGLAPYNSVRFVYDSSRPDVITTYRAGSLMRTTVLLTNVQTYAGNTLVSDYRLTYSTGAATGRKRLRTVTLCDGAGACLPATTIGWTNAGDLAQGFAKTTIPVAEMMPDYYDVFGSGDFNGDGLTDLYIDRADEYGRAVGTYDDQLWLAKGDGTFNRLTISAAESIPDNYQVFGSGDFNGDGLTDFYLQYSKQDGRAQGLPDNTAAAYVWLAKSDGTFNRVSVPAAESMPDRSRVFGSGDFNGDGLVDFYLQYRREAGRAYGPPDNSLPAQLWTSPGPPPDILASVTDGLGAQTKITYKPMTDGSVYTKDSGANAASYPVVDIQGTMQITSRIERSDGLGGLRVSTYRYAGAKMDLTGRGFLGFREMIAKDEQTGIEQRSVYKQHYPFTLLKKSTERSLNGVVLSRQINGYDVVDLGGTRRRVLLTQSMATGADLDGTPLPTVITTYQYDTFNNATQIVVATSDGHGKTTTNTYSNDTTKWLLGRLTRAAVSSVAPGSGGDGVDITPDPFDFTDTTDRPINSFVASNSIAVSGINTPMPVFVSGDGSPQIRINGGAWATSGTITNGQSLEVRLTSAGTFDTQRSATVSVGGERDTWSVTTGACGGESVGGYCWYASASHASCDAACATHGGCNLTGTRDYAGSGGSNANCQAVLNALELGSGSVLSLTGSSGAGCSLVSLLGDIRARDTSNTTCSATIGGSGAATRACACNN